MAPFERAMVVSYRLSIVTTAQSVFCNHSAAICDRMSATLKSIGGGSLLAQISGCYPWSTPMKFGSAESERTTLTKLTVKLFSKNSNLCDHNPPTSQTDRQTDGRADRRHAIARPRFARSSDGWAKNQLGERRLGELFFGRQTIGRQARTVRRQQIGRLGDIVLQTVGRNV